MHRSHLRVLIVPLLVAACGVVHPPVTVEHTQSGVTVHCESLGEYPSDIGRVEVTECASGQTVWRVEPSSGKVFQLHKFPLSAGVNSGSLPLSWGRARTVIPSRGVFILTRGVEYQVAVCAPEGLKRCGRAIFKL